MAKALGEVKRLNRLELIRFRDKTGDSCVLYAEKSYISALDEKEHRGVAWGRRQVVSVVAHLTAWLETGSLKLKGEGNE